MTQQVKNKIKYNNCSENMSEMLQLCRGWFYDHHYAFETVENC